MAGSTFGNIFKITTWGESHGKALGVVVDGCPAGLPLSEEEIQKYLDRRKPGTSAITTQRKEADDFIPVAGYRGYRIGIALRGLFYGFCVSYGDFCFCGISFLCARGYPESSERETENEITRIFKRVFLEIAASGKPQ